MITNVLSTILLSLLIEGTVTCVVTYLIRKPTFSILITICGASLFTQCLLWAILLLFPQHYLSTLFIVEILIWLIEAIILRVVPKNQLSWHEALWFSLIINGVSFGIGLFLRV